MTVVVFPESNRKSLGVHHEPFVDTAEALEHVRVTKKKQKKLNLVLVMLVALITIGCIVYVSAFARPFDAPPLTPVRVCYYGYGGEDGLIPENINATLCSHIIYSAVDIVNNTLYPNGKDAVWKRLVKLKTHYPDLHVLLSIAASPTVFSNVTANDTSLNTLVESVVRAVKKYEFDGIDIDWEFPAWNGQPWEDRKNFVKLLQKLRERFDSPGEFSPGEHILLTTAVAAPFTIVEISYDIAGMSQYIDFCLLMGYDYNRYNPVFPVAEFNSPLFKHKGQIAFLADLNLAWSSNYFISRGMPKNKMVVGLPFYAVTFKLDDVTKHEVGAPVKGIGLYDGSGSYPQICDFLEKGGTRVFNNESRVPYAFQDDNWISYDDEQSVGEKVTWIVNNNFAGVMTFDLNSDDFAKQCNSSKTSFPLQTRVYDIMTQKL